MLKLNEVTNMRNNSRRTVCGLSKWPT